ncbi:DUF6624 domain-containing protein [Terriglobus sp. ADX1]|uniref:DUF6624 domain-containing protein n=1 Tax=Terriglobus sp. ADX1 TaxID=2794063 RepID=UPI002FE67FC5
MLLPIVLAASLAMSDSDQALAIHIREITTRRLLTQVPSEEAAIDAEVQVIYAKHGLLTRSEVGDEAAYDFIFLLTNQLHAFQTRVLKALDQPGAGHDLPPDAVTFLRTRYRLDGVKAARKGKLPTDPALRDMINSLYEADQAVRRQSGFDPKRLGEIDRAHTEQLQTIVKEHGVPTFSTVGPEAAGHFVVMIQHQSAQMRDVVLPLLRAHVDQGEADPESYALVYDLSQVDQSKDQRFGERLVCLSGKLKEAPIEDEKHVNERRAEIGLMRVELYSYLVSQTMPQMCSASSS